MSEDYEQLREDYRRLLLAHPDDQHAALIEYLNSDDGGSRSIDAARQKIAEGWIVWHDRCEAKPWEQEHANKLADESA